MFPEGVPRGPDSPVCCLPCELWLTAGECWLDLDGQMLCGPPGCTGSILDLDWSRLLALRRRRSRRTGRCRGVPRGCIAASAVSDANESTKSYTVPRDAAYVRAQLANDRGELQALTSPGWRASHRKLLARH